jgi:membrane associated rhomboid family serine protease
MLQSLGFGADVRDEPLKAASEIRFRSLREGGDALPLFLSKAIRGLLSHGAMHQPPPVDSPARPEPITFAPPAVLALIALMLGLHAWRAFGLGLYEDADVALLKPLAFVAARFSIMTGMASAQDVLREVLAAEPALRPLKRALYGAFVAPGGGAPWTVVTYAFLHAGWEHVIFNSLWLLVFGSPVMARFGLARFLVFFALTAAAAAIFHALMHSRDVSILVGASGAVSGLTAAALRFAFTGDAFGGRNFHAPAPPLTEVMRDRRVAAFVIVWFGLNLLAGLGMPLSAGGEARIAWEAHVGGFFAGLALFPLFDPVRQVR